MAPTEKHYTYSVAHSNATDTAKWMSSNSVGRVYISGLP